MSTAHLPSQISRLLLSSSFTALCLILSACELFVGSNALKNPTITLTADPASITLGQTAILTVAATQATQVTITGSDGSTYSLGTAGGAQSVKPTATTTYTATATNSKGERRRNRNRHGFDSQGNGKHHSYSFHDHQWFLVDAHSNSDK